MTLDDFCDQVEKQANFLVNTGDYSSETGVYEKFAFFQDKKDPNIIYIIPDLAKASWKENAEHPTYVINGIERPAMWRISDLKYFQNRIDEITNTEKYVRDSWTDADQIEVLREDSDYFTVFYDKERSILTSAINGLLQHYAH